MYYAQDTFDFLWSVRKDGSESRPKAVQTVAGAPPALVVKGLAGTAELFRPGDFDAGPQQHYRGTKYPDERKPGNPILWLRRGNLCALGNNDIGEVWI